VARHLVLQLRDPRDAGVVHARAGQLAGERLERRDDLERVAQLRARQPGDPRAAVRQQVHQPLGRQHFERLAQRRA
jgi:hypothetical protein